MLVCAGIFCVQPSYGQSTFTQVHRILKTNCSVGSCHNSDGGNIPAGHLDLGGTETSVYNALLNVSPTNPAADNAKMKRIWPGNPHRSYLYRKLNRGLEQGYDLPDNSFGETMPKDDNRLPKSEIHLIHQWIMWGAPQTGSVVDSQLIANYHAGLGYPAMTPPAPPAVSEGIQIHYGPIFIEGGQEIEFNHKQELEFEGDIDVTRIELWMNWQSHHYLMYSFDNQASADQVPDGLRVLTLTGAAFESGRGLVSGWQFSNDITLPPGTAYFWPSKVFLDHNYHIPNVNDPDTILKADLYLNIYKRSRHALSTEMHSALYIYDEAGIWPFSDFYILPNSTDHTFTEAFYDQNAAVTDSAHIWLLASHTHKYGKDYDIYIRNPNGSRGEQLYEGFMNRDYTFNQGYYDWQHPAIRYFPDEDLKTIAWKDGFIHEAVYNNYGTQAVTFGLTTDEEMMLMFYQYTDQKPIPFTGLEEADRLKGLYFGVSPNPIFSSANINYSIPRYGHVQVEIYDLLGNRISKPVDVQRPAGRHKEMIDVERENLTPGMFLVKITANGQSESRKIIVLK